MTNSFKNNRREEDKKYLVLCEEISIIKSELNTNTISTTRINEKLDYIEPIIHKIADIIQTAEMAFKVLSAAGNGVSWVVKKLSKIAKVLLPIGTLLLVSSTILQQFFNRDLSTTFASWWNSFVELFK